MTITYVIPGATLLDQLAPTTLDGLANNDAQDNCVGTSIAEALHILTGRAFDGDEVKDAVYGAGYVGVESAAHYVAYCAAQGVDLVAHTATQAGLIATIHAEVGAGHPVVLTMPSQWGTAPVDPVHPAGSTHVGVAVGLGTGEIRVMNPWHGFYQDESDAWWQARLCYGQVWVMSHIVAAPVPVAAGGGTTNMWTNAGNGAARDTRGVTVHFAMATYLLAHPTLGDVVQGFSGETYYDANRSFLPLEGDAVLQWDKTRGSVVEAGGEVAVDLWHALQAAQAHVAALQAQLTAAQSAASSSSADSVTLDKLRVALKALGL